jgi:hypothetical protein
MTADNDNQPDVFNFVTGVQCPLRCVTKAL